MISSVVGLVAEACLALPSTTREEALSKCETSVAWNFPSGIFTTGSCALAGASEASFDGPTGLSETFAATCWS